MSVYENRDDGERTFESTTTLTTLVEPSHLRTFIFNRSSVVNATIYSRARPVYKIKSNSSLSRTELFDLNEQEIVALIKRRQILPNLVVFGHRGNKSIRISKWLKRRKVFDGQT